jgi:hypothetical protein
VGGGGAYQIEIFVASDVEGEGQRNEVHVDAERAQGGVSFVATMVAEQRKPEQADQKIANFKKQRNLACSVTKASFYLLSLCAAAPRSPSWRMI